MIRRQLSHVISSYSIGHAPHRLTSLSLTSDEHNSMSSDQIYNEKARIYEYKPLRPQDHVITYKYKRALRI